MPNPTSEEMKEKWKMLILQQQESGLSIERWCRNNEILPHNFHYWKNKLFPKILDCSSFKKITIKDQENDAPKEMKISIEYHGFWIHLESDFNVSALKECLKAFKEAEC